MKYIHKPTEVDAIQFTGDNCDELMIFAPDNIDPTTAFGSTSLRLKNANGYLDINKGDYVIKGEKEGDFWVCAEDVFNRSYEAKE